MEKAKLLERMHADGGQRLLLARILDKLEQAERRGAPVSTDFLSPQEQALTEELLRVSGVTPDRYVLFGGFEGAERKMLLFLPDWMEQESAVEQFPLCCLRAAFRPEEALTHRDLLGSLMGIGVAREKVGDLLVSDASCDLIAATSVGEFLLQNWVSAGRAKLTVTAITPQELCVPEVRCEEIRDTVQTLRLDAVTAVGFRLSRGKAAALIEGGKVQVNWRDCVKSDHLLSEGDVVSARGFGKFNLKQVGGMTRKGRTGIIILRYL